MNPAFFRFIAWTSLALIAFATLGPIDLRPTSSFSPSIERFFAFAAVGFAFAMAYPKRFWLTMAVVLGAAMMLEILQIVSPSRHGRLFDALVKMSGGAIGLMIGWLLQRFGKHSKA
jgi:glycopeptide antibiotics resistance protein